MKLTYPRSVTSFESAEIILESYQKTGDVTLLDTLANKWSALLHNEEILPNDLKDPKRSARAGDVVNSLCDLMESPSITPATGALIAEGFLEQGADSERHTGRAALTMGDYYREGKNFGAAASMYKRAMKCDFSAVRDVAAAKMGMGSISSYLFKMDMPVVSRAQKFQYVVGQNLAAICNPITDRLLQGATRLFKRKAAPETPGV